MTDYIREVYAAKPETRIYRSHTGRKKRVNTILLGTWLGVVEEREDGWLKVKTIGPDGWVRVEDTRTDMGMKLFFIDVGQGDAALNGGDRYGDFDGRFTDNGHAGWEVKWKRDNHIIVGIT